MSSGISFLIYSSLLSLGLASVESRYANCTIQERQITLTADPPYHRVVSMHDIACPRKALMMFFNSACNRRKLQ